MKKTIDVCDECGIGTVDVIVSGHEYCSSCAMEKYNIKEVYVDRCSHCNNRLYNNGSRSIFIDNQDNVYCSLECATAEQPWI